jgi:hypothetical protein
MEPAQELEYVMKHLNPYDRPYPAEMQTILKKWKLDETQDPFELTNQLLQLLESLQKQ